MEEEIPEKLIGKQNLNLEEQKKHFRRTREFLARIFTPTRIESKTSAQSRIIEEELEGKSK